jgi:uncharacterized protein YrrD
MNRSVVGLEGCRVHAKDGDIGKVDECYFDDDTWTIRYLVVQTGSWLSDRRVLISPIFAREADWQNRRIAVPLTRDEVRNSPDIDTAKPISRQHEIQLNNYYGWQSYYWMGPEIWGAGTIPYELWMGWPPATLPKQVKEEQNPAPIPHIDIHETHLRSAKEVIGYNLKAKDGEIGHVQDFLFDDESWRIQYIVADTSNWWFSKKVIISPSSVKNVDWADRLVHVGLSRDSIQNSPEAVMQNP